MPLKREFYHRNDVTRIARDLLGKALFTRMNGKVTSGLIVETEAYSWTERGCHAWGSRKTKRNAIMFGEGGHAYVYLCYGMYNLFNVVTNREGRADAVLIRALEPIEGIAVMQRRTGASRPSHITSGPGKLTRALGISRDHNGLSLDSKHLWLEDVGKKVKSNDIKAGPRIGIDYAGEDAFLPWRFTIRDNEWVSR